MPDRPLRETAEKMLTQQTTKFSGPTQELEVKRLSRAVLAAEDLANAAEKWLATGIIDGTDRFKASDLVDLRDTLAAYRRESGKRNSDA